MLQVEDASGVQTAPDWLQEGIGTVLRTYQREWLKQSYGSKDFAPLDVLHLGGRQLGKDHTWAFDVALDMSCRKKRKWSILSASHSHSKDFLSDVSTHLDFLRDLHRWNGVGFPEKDNDSAEQITLSNGSSIRAFAATAKNAQGRRGNIILNELSIMPSAELIFETADAVVQGQRTQGRDASTRIIGNAGVIGSFYQRLWDDDEKSGSFVKIVSSWEDEITSWLTTDLGHPLAKAKAWVALKVAQIIARLGHAAYGQWYCCIFRSPEEGFFDSKILTRQSYDPDDAPADFPELHDERVRQGVGWDPSRRRHPAGICNCLEGKEPDRRDAGGDFKPRNHYLHNPARMTKWDWWQQEEELDRRIKQRRTVKVAIDRQGIGDKPSEDAQIRYGSGMVEAYDFSPARRMALLNHSLDAFERGLLWIPIDTDLRMEYESIQRAYSAVGRETAIIPEQQGKHGDMAVAGMLAEWALSNPGSGGMGGWQL